MHPGDNPSPTVRSRDFGLYRTISHAEFQKRCNIAQMCALTYLCSCGGDMIFMKGKRKMLLTARKNLKPHSVICGFFSFLLRFSSVAGCPGWLHELCQEEILGMSLRLPAPAHILHSCMTNEDHIIEEPSSPAVLSTSQWACNNLKISAIFCLGLGSRFSCRPSLTAEAQKLITYGLKGRTIHTILWSQGSSVVDRGILLF